MEILFYLTAGLAVLGVGLAVTARQAVHALLFLVVAVLAISMNLYILGNELFGVLLVIVYAGAVMVLFIFVVMLLNPVPSKMQVSVSSIVRNFFGPLVISGVILLVFVVVATSGESVKSSEGIVPAADIVSAFFIDGWFFVELLSLLLTAAFIGAFHIGKRHSA